MSSPLIAIVGRPNVGKSTLFNAMTRTRLAIVADKEGVTRDRRIHAVRPPELERREIRLMDTGGWMPEAWRRSRSDIEILKGIEEQILAGLAEASLILFVVDARAGLTTLDEELARYLRKKGREFVVLCNKVDTSQLEDKVDEFRRMGGKGTYAISAEHKRGLSGVWETIQEFLPESEEDAETREASAKAEREAEEDAAAARAKARKAAKASAVEKMSARGKVGVRPKASDFERADEAMDEDAGLPFEKRPIRVCIVGRPNVGKSSFLNALLGETRAVESPIPGTTTDPVDITVERGGQLYTVIDTAGIRRHAKRADDVENLSVMYAKRNLEKVDLAFLMLDAADGVTAQDAKIAALVRESGAAAIVIANKWDLAPERLRDGGKPALEEFVEAAKKDVPFLDYAPTLAGSAKAKRIYAAVSGSDSDSARPLRIKPELDGLWPLVRELASARDVKVPVTELNELVDRVALGGPNISQNVGKVYFAHRVPVKSPVFCAYVRDPKKVPDAYARFLTRAVRNEYGFRGNPIKWIFRYRRELKQHKDTVIEWKIYQKTKSQD